ncbi:MAG: hypothetical protein ISS70_26430 [Phycisphaerae bacterium]|nr:hypothetical protein [Phycisphaerae bacterium]
MVAEKIGFIADKDITRNEGKNQISIVCPTTGDAQTVLKFLQEVDAEPIQVRIDVRVVEAYPDVELDWETRVAARNITGAKTTSNAKREESLSAPDILRETAKAEPQPENSVEKLVDLLASRGYLKILMNPKIEVLDGKTARIQSSQRPPDGNEIVTSFEITPRILDDGSIGVAANMIYNNMQLGDPRTHINIKDGVSRLIGSVTKTEKHAIVRDGVKGLEQRTTEVLVILTPTIITPERNLSKKSAVQVEREEVWGEAVDGLQLRLRTEKLVWKSGKGPILKADVRNNGTKMKAVPMFPLGYLVEIDGVSYSDQVVRSHWASDTWNAQVRLAPGEERIGVEISLDEHTKYSKGDLRGALDPGKHIVRIGFPHDDLASKENQFFSNPVVIEILPEAKPDVQVEGEITKDLGGHKGLEFLAGIPEFRDLRLDMTERQLRLHIHLHSLAATFHEKGDETTYHLFTGEGENVFVMFRNGQCTGIQRMRLDRQTALKLFEEKRLSEPDAFSAYHKACRFLYEGGDRIEAAKRFREAAQLAPATKYGAWGRELAVLLVGMAKEQRPVVDKPLRSSFIITGDVSIVQNIEDLIFDLRDVAVQSMFVPGKCRVLRQMTIAPKSSTPNPAQRLKVLAKRGSGCDELVIPRLIKLLSDNRPTRSWAGEMNGGHVLRYCDLALEIIADAAEVKLPNETTTFDTRTTRDAYLGNADEGTRSEIISRVKAWWQKEKNNSDVQVDTKTAESAEKLDIESLLAKVRRALQPTDNMRVSWRFETVEPFEWGTTKSMHTVREYTATISGFKSRLEYLQKTYTSKASKEPYIIHRETYVFDGKQCRNLVEPVKGGNTTKIGWVKPQNVTAVLLYQELFAFVLPLHDEDKLNEYEFNLADSPSPGIYVVKIIGPEDGSPNQMTIDGRRGFNIINTQWFGPKNRKTLEDRTVLRQYDDGIWYPAERRRIRYYPNGTHKLEHIDKFSKLELDVKVPEDTFTLEFPPGTKTWDATLDDWVLISNSDSSGKKLAADGEGKN